MADLPVRPLRFFRWNMLDAYFAVYHRKPILFGKPSFTPPALDLLYWELRDFPDRRSITLLRALKVPLALVHPKRWEGARRKRSLRRLAGRGERLALVHVFPDRDDPLWDRYDLGGELLYEIRPLSDQAAPRECPCREVDRTSFRLTASGVNDPSLAVDGDRTTKWRAGEAQEAGAFLEIALDRPRRIARIEIEMVFPYGEFARHLQFTGYSATESWSIPRLEDPWYTAALVRRLVDDPIRARLRYDLEPTTVERVRLFLERTEEGALGWAIPELHLYEVATAGQDSSPAE